jgi:hypothetical protein
VNDETPVELNDRDSISAMIFRAIVNVHACLYIKAVWKRIRPAYAISWHSTSKFGLKDLEIDHP